MKKVDVHKKLLFLVFVPLCVCFGESKARAQLVACYMASFLSAEKETATIPICIQTPIKYSINNNL